MNNDFLFIDLYPLSPLATDDALEYIFKSRHDRDDGIWKPHHSPFIRRIIEFFTKRGLDRLTRVRDNLLDWYSGKMYIESPELIPAPPMMERWSQEQLLYVKKYLESLFPDDWTLDDHMMVVDYIVQRYLPADELKTEAEWLAVRSSLMGKVQANIDKQNITSLSIDKILAALPLTVEAASVFALPKQEEAALKFAAFRAAENVKSLTDSVRHQLKSEILNHLEGNEPFESLQTKLFDRFATLNRDWRRIAVTEAGEAQTQGFVASLPYGTKIKRSERYANACAFCTKIDGVEATVVSPTLPNKDPDTMVWVGKNNIGRSASPKKRVGNVLIPRSKDEMWHLPAGLAHPHCFISPHLPIYTINGWVAISKIAVGDLVLTHTGKFRPVTWVLSGVRHTGDVVRIRANFEGKNAFDVAEMTSEHPILTTDGWVSAGQITTNHKIKVLAKVCASCSRPFVNAKHKNVVYCSNACIPNSGVNQFTDISSDERSLLTSKISDHNSRRMKGMTIEQRRALTSNGRMVTSRMGYGWLHTEENRKKLMSSVAKNNYSPSKSELNIIQMLSVLGFDATPQYRVLQSLPDSIGRPRYWFADIALVDQKIIIEIDGEPWHGRLAKDGHDERRDADLSSLGWTVIRFDSKDAALEPEKVVDAIVRLSMNHSDEYVFGDVSVESVNYRPVSNVKLYNFGVDIDESYIIGRGVVVHNCRGRWLPVIEEQEGDDKEFGAWLKQTLGS